MILQNYKDSPEERYVRDPQFHALVSCLEAFIHKAQFSPSELREAVILAATRYEMRRPIAGLRFEEEKPPTPGSRFEPESEDGR
jgi:hypothetical protein